MTIVIRLEVSSFYEDAVFHERDDGRITTRIGPAYIAVNATSVYWTNIHGNGTIMTAPLSGGTPNASIV